MCQQAIDVTTTISAYFPCLLISHIGCSVPRFALPISSRLLPYSKCRPQLAFKAKQILMLLPEGILPSILHYQDKHVFVSSKTEKPRVDLPFYFRSDVSQRHTHSINSNPAMSRCYTDMQEARSNHKDDSIVMASILFVPATLVHEDAMESHGDLQSFCWETTSYFLIKLHGDLQRFGWKTKTYFLTKITNRLLHFSYKGLAKIRGNPSSLNNEIHNFPPSFHIHQEQCV